MTTPPPPEHNAHGYAVYRVMPSAVERAREVRAQRDTQTREGKGLWLADESKRWVGELGEMVVALYLTQMSVPAWKHNGGIDNLPDFWIMGAGVGVKTTTRNVPMQPKYNLLMPAQHMREESTEMWLLFLSYNEAAETIEIVGFIDRNMFKMTADRFEKGQPLPGSRRPALNACWLLRAANVITPRRWLAGERGR